MDVQRKIRIIRILEALCVTLTAHDVAITLLSVFLASNDTLVSYTKWSVSVTFYAIVGLSLIGLIAVNRARVQIRSQVSELAPFMAAVQITFLCFYHFLNK
jgi:hypothetical protein